MRLLSVRLKHSAFLFQHACFAIDRGLIHFSEVRLHVVELALHEVDDLTDICQRCSNCRDVRLVRQFANLILERGDRVLNAGRVRSDQLKLRDQAVVELNRQLWRKAEDAGQVAFDSEFQTVSSLQQCRLFSFNALPELVDLRQIDDSCLEMRLQHGQRSELLVEAVF